MFPADSCLVNSPRVIARVRAWMRCRHSQPVRHGHKHAFEFLRVDQVLPYPRIRLADLKDLPDEAFQLATTTPARGASGVSLGGDSQGLPRSRAGRLPLTAEMRRSGRFALHGAGGAPLRRWEASLLRAQAQTVRGKAAPSHQLLIMLLRDSVLRWSYPPVRWLLVRCRAGGAGGGGASDGEGARAGAGNASAASTGQSRAVTRQRSLQREPSSSAANERMLSHSRRAAVTCFLPAPVDCLCQHNAPSRESGRVRSRLRATSLQETLDVSPFQVARPCAADRAYSTHESTTVQLTHLALSTPVRGCYRQHFLL